MKFKLKGTLTGKVTKVRGEAFKKKMLSTKYKLVNTLKNDLTGFINPLSD